MSMERDELQLKKKEFLEKIEEMKKVFEEIIEEMKKVFEEYIELKMREEQGIYSYHKNYWKWEEDNGFLTVWRVRK